MFKFSIDTVSVKPFRHSVVLAASMESPNISIFSSFNLTKLASIFFASLLSVGCGSGDWGNTRTLEGCVVSFYDANLELLEARYAKFGDSINLDDKKREHGVLGWYQAKNATAVEGHFTISEDVNFYAAPNVIEISNQAELNSIRNGLSGNYSLTRDIKLRAGEAGFDEIHGWSPIGDLADAFTGIFNGNSHKISGLWIDRPTAARVGLFGCVEIGTIKNLGVLTDETKWIQGEDYVGGIAGVITTDSVITNSYFAGNISADNFVGGIAGHVYGDSTIRGSYSKLSISGTTNVGGIAGRVEFGSMVTNSYSIGSVIGDNTNIGGIAGEVYDFATITESYSEARISGGIGVGGIAGNVGYSSTVINNAAINQEIGGLVDINRIVGYISGSNTITNNFALSITKIEIEGDNGKEGTLKSIAQLKSRLTYMGNTIADGKGGLGWDFATTWKIDDGVGYPYLYWED
ncbi:MAG: hypothetical protein LBQ18_08015 [Campylobacteraceae bacterium]|jgi:hypothetical protein|nr:hypothetical protein [Campylobacteraceae bacterium]